MTIRESGELVGLRETLAKLSKEWETRRNYARVQFRGKLVATGADTWQIQIGSCGSWNLHFGAKNERKALAREQKGKRVLITGTITADPGVEPTVNVESLQSAGE
jgi:hypothetical protein